MDKKAQQEMVGFVLIVILVSIIGVIFLSLFLNQKQTYNDGEVSSLLQSAMYYTSNCYSSNNEPKQIEDLIQNCYTNENRKCSDGRKVCDALEITIKKALDESLKPGEEYKNKAYNLSIYYRAVGDNNSPIKNILFLNNGKFNNCSIVKGASHSVMVSSSFGGFISVDLIVCKNQNTK